LSSDFCTFDWLGMVKWYRIFSVLVMLVTSTSRGFSAPAPPGGTTTGGPGPCFPDPCLPIDQGEYLLLAFGLIFALYFLFRKENKAAN
jgi:hypothetical protein